MIARVALTGDLLVLVHRVTPAFPEMYEITQCFARGGNEEFRPNSLRHGEFCLCILFLVVPGSFLVFFSLRTFSLFKLNFSQN